MRQPGATWSPRNEDEKRTLNGNHLFAKNGIGIGITGVGKVEGGQLLFPGQNFFCPKINQQPLQQGAVGVVAKLAFKLALEC